MKYLKTYNENKLIKDHLSVDGKTLNLNNLSLTELPELPKGLERLYCGNNQLTKLPELPPTLEYLYCYNNQLTELPELPPILKYLYCDNNQLPYDDLEGYWKWYWKENPDLHQANKMNLI